MNVEAARINPGLALAVIGALALPVGLIAGLVGAPAVWSLVVCAAALARVADIGGG